MEHKVKGKPGPKPESYTITSPEMKAIPGSDNISTARQYQRLLDYMALPADERDPCICLGSTVPPSPQMRKNASIKLKALKILKKHGITSGLEYKPPRHFEVKLDFQTESVQIEHNALYIELATIEGATWSVDNGLLVINVEEVQDNDRETSKSVWVVTYPNGEPEVIKREQDPRAAHRWMHSSQRPWNVRMTLPKLDLCQI